MPKTCVIIHAHVYRIRDLYDDGDEAICSESRSIKNRYTAGVGDVQQTEIDVSDTHVADNVWLYQPRTYKTELHSRPDDYNIRSVIR